MDAQTRRPARPRRPAVSCAVFGIALAAASAAVLAVPTVSQAAPAEAIQVVGVELSADAAIEAMGSATALRDDAGKVADSSVLLDPAQHAAALPVRVATAYWLDGQTGTDLAEIAGQAGRVIVEVAVQNLTAQPREITFEVDGSQYRQTDLVGVPLTVAGAVDLGQPDDTSIVFDPLASQPAGPDRVTNGVVGRDGAGDWTIQWAALLAPPLLSPTSTFTLVLDTDNFQPPVFDLSVQLGLHLDPSIQEVIATALGPDGQTAQLEEATVQLLLDVNQQADQARQFVEEVHQALSRDVEQMGARTYAELLAASQQILEQLARTEQALNAIRDSAEQRIRGAQDDLASQLQAMVDDISQTVLGSKPADADYTDGSVAGCADIVLPAYADPDGAKTLTQTIGLVDRQLGTITEAFQRSDGDSGEPDNCRYGLIGQLKASLGDPAARCDTSAPAGTVLCQIDVAQERLAASSDQLGVGKGLADAFQTDVGAGRLARQAQALDTALTTLAEAVWEQTARLAGQRDEAVDHLIRDSNDGLLRQLGAVRGQVVQIRTAMTGLTAAAGPIAQAADATASLEALIDSNPDSLLHRLDGIAAADNEATVMEWLEESDLLAAVDALGSGCLDLRAIGAAADLDEVNRQLTGLRRPLCSPAQVDLAAALAHDAADYLAVLDDISRRAQVPPAQRGGVSLAFHGVEEALADLAAQAADIDAALTALDDGDPATDDDLLDAVAGKIAQIEAALDAGSGFQAALDSLTGLVSTTEPHRLNGFQSGVVAPLGAAPGAAACADALAASGSDLLSADAVLFHSNQLTCQTMAFGVAMAEWHAAATAAYATAADSLAKAQTQTVQTFNDSANRVHVVSDRLVEALTTTDPDGAAVSLVWPDYAQIDAAERLAQDRMRDTAARFGDSADGIVAALSEQVNASAADSLAARETLGAAFETLMANLGGAGLDSRVGMLGKLRGIAAQVGDTGAVLSALVQATAAYGNDRAADLRAVKLRAAEFQVVQDSSTDYPAFAGAPDGTQNLATVFSFHVGGRK